MSASNILPGVRPVTDTRQEMSMNSTSAVSWAFFSHVNGHRV